jgi:DNA-binding SARP family transcriptional activator
VVVVKADLINQLIQQTLKLEVAGQMAAAFQTAQQAVEQARLFEDRELLGAAQVCLAKIYFRLSQYPEAQDLARQALAGCGQTTCVRADALLILGMVAGETYDICGSEDFFHQAILISRQIGYDKALYQALHSLSAGVYMPRGQFALSLAADEEALRLSRDRELVENSWGAYITISWIYWLMGRYTESHKNLALLRQVAKSGSFAEGYYFLISGAIATDEQQYVQAAECYVQTRSIAERLGSAELNILLRVQLSVFHRMQGEYCKARDWAEDAFNRSVRIQYRHLQGVSLLERGWAAWLLGDLQNAETDLLKSIEIMLPLQTQFDLARAYLALAGIYHHKTNRKNKQFVQDSRLAWKEAAERILNGGFEFLLDKERRWVYALLAAHQGDEISKELTEKLLIHLQQLPAEALNIKTLGKFEIQRGTQLVDPRLLRQRRAEDLFCLLLLQPGHCLSREQIFEALWPDQTPESVQVRFHHASSTLRRALEPDLPEKFPSHYLEVDGGQVCLNLPPGSSVDFEQFEALAAQGESRQAAELYGGILFPNLLSVDWSVAPREALGQRYLRVLLTLARQFLEAHEYSQAAETCRKILHLEPWQEQAALYGMQACQAMQDRAGAFRFYHNLSAALERDLGIKPQEDVEDFFQHMKNNK